MAYHIAEIHAHRDREDELTSLLLNSEAQGVSAEGAPFVRDSIEAGFAEEWDVADLVEDDLEIIVKGYYPTDDRWFARRDKLQRDLDAFKAVYPQDIYDVLFWTLEDESWLENWKKHYKPLRVGAHLVIRPEWEEYEPIDGDLVITIDPGLAFGTGDHPTTGGVLRLLEEYVTPGMRAMDIGCGTGILSVATVLLGAEKVTAVDNDREAIRVTVRNGRLNGVLDKMDVMEKDLTRHTWDHFGKYDLIVANIVAGVIEKMIPHAAMTLKEGGYFIGGGIIRSKESYMLDCLHEYGLHVREIVEEGDWVTLLAEKPPLTFGAVYKD